MMVALVRHAEAIPHAATDAERSLTPLGRLQATAQAAWLARILPPGVLIVHSPYLRAVQTADIFATQIKGHRITDEALAAHRSVSDVVDTITAYSHGNVVVVGHLPTIAEALARLTASPSQVFLFSPATVALLESPSRGTDLFTLRAIVPPDLILP